MNENKEIKSEAQKLIGQKKKNVGYIQANVGIALRDLMNTTDKSFITFSLNCSPRILGILESYISFCRFKRLNSFLSLLCSYVARNCKPINRNNPTHNITFKM